MIESSPRINVETKDAEHPDYFYQTLEVQWEEFKFHKKVYFYTERKKTLESDYPGFREKVLIHGFLAILKALAETMQGAAIRAEVALPYVAPDETHWESREAYEQHTGRKVIDTQETRTNDTDS